MKRESTCSGLLTLCMHMHGVSSPAWGRGVGLDGASSQRSVLQMVPKCTTMTKGTLLAHVERPSTCHLISRIMAPTYCAQWWLQHSNNVANAAVQAAKAAGVEQGALLLGGGAAAWLAVVVVTTSAAQADRVRCCRTNVTENWDAPAGANPPCCWGSGGCRCKGITAHRQPALHGAHDHRWRCLGTEAQALHEYIHLS